RLRDDRLGRWLSRCRTRVGHVTERGHVHLMQLQVLSDRVETTDRFPTFVDPGAFERPHDLDWATDELRKVVLSLSGQLVRLTDALGRTVHVGADVRVRWIGVHQYVFVFQPEAGRNGTTASGVVLLSIVDL